MSLSLHSSMEYFGGSNRWSRNDSDIVPWKSSIGEISSKISSRPLVSGTSVRSASTASWTRDCQASLPINQSKDCVCSCRRSGTASGSTIFAKEIREAVRDGNRCPSGASACGRCGGRWCDGAGDGRQGAGDGWQQVVGVVRQTGGSGRRDLRQAKCCRYVPG